MQLFYSDYMEAAHEDILRRIAETNLEKNPGYGSDPYTESAKQRIREACGKENAEVDFLVGGTQTNSIVIDAILCGSEGVVAASSGHINCHEAGAIEMCGHKVLTVPSHQGKMDAGELEAFIERFYADGAWQHCVIPAMAYISFPTEYGTIYTKNELSAIYSVCRKHNIPLFVDGARLGYGLQAEGCDVTLKDLADLCDVFYIGGTKVGAMFGEAVVITNPRIRMTMGHIKQHGALLAKGWLLGLQFDTLFANNLYMDIAKNAISQAITLREGLRAKGYKFLFESPTNQQFIIVGNEELKAIEQRAGVAFWEVWEPSGDNATVIRFCTSWATTSEQIQQILSVM